MIVIAGGISISLTKWRKIKLQQKISDQVLAFVIWLTQQSMTRYEDKNGNIDYEGKRSVKSFKLKIR